MRETITDETQFLNHIIEEYYKSLCHSQDDNFDYRKFSEQDKPVFLNSFRPAFAKYFFSHVKGFYRSYALLKDNYSRRIFIKLILYKLAGPDHVKINTLCFSDIKRHIENMAQKEHQSALDYTYNGTPIVRYKNITYLDQTITIDTVKNGILNTFYETQYDYNQGEINIVVEQGDIVIDAGTFLGDTAIKFAVMAGKNGHVYGFDPIPAHIKTTQYNAEQNNLRNIDLLPFGLDRDKNNIPPIKRSVSDGNEVLPDFKTDDKALPLTSIDHFCNESALSKLDFIKMDIEGAEMDALIGARNSINTFRPKLAISLYHKHSDFVEIPQYITKEHPFYDFYLDHHTLYAGETILYAKPKNEHV